MLAAEDSSASTFGVYYNPWCHNARGEKFAVSASTPTAPSDGMAAGSAFSAPPRVLRACSSVARSSGAELDTESGRVRVAKKLRLQAFIEGRTQEEVARALNVSQATVSQTLSASKRALKRRLGDAYND